MLHTGFSRIQSLGVVSKRCERQKQSRSFSVIIATTTTTTPQVFTTKKPRIKYEVFTTKKPNITYEVFTTKKPRITYEVISSNSTLPVPSNNVFIVCIFFSIKVNQL